jgi:hypothetical protein
MRRDALTTSGPDAFDAVAKKSAVNVQQTDDRSGNRIDIVAYRFLLVHLQRKFDQSKFHA